MKRINKSKLFLMISISILIICLLGGTYAYYKSLLSSGIGVISTTHSLDYYINYVKGDDVTASELNPSTSYIDGISSRIEFWKKDDSYDIYGRIELTVNSIGSNLSNSSALKYAVVNENSGLLLSSGTLKGVTANSKVTVLKNLYLEQTKQIYIVYVWIDSSEELGDLSGESLDISIDCIANLNKEPSASTYITDLYTDASKTTITNNNIQYKVASSVGLMNDRLGGTTTSLDGGNIRYYGSEPNNYLYFNCDTYPTTDCELWRIVGVFDGKLKIIRNSPIGNYSWDNKNIDTGATTNLGKNDWTEARLMKLLNPSNYYTIVSGELGQSLYYNGTAGKCYNGDNNVNVDCDFSQDLTISVVSDPNDTTGNSSTYTSQVRGIKNNTTRDMMAETIWNIGETENAFTYFSNQGYMFERRTTNFSENPITWKGKIGLIYPSDYGYAANLTKCVDSSGNDLHLNNYSDSYNSYQCRVNNWLFSNDYQWLLTPMFIRGGTISDSLSSAINLEGMVGYTNVSKPFSVRPTLYLSPNVLIVSGDGSLNSPYTLSF